MKVSKNEKKKGEVANGSVVVLVMEELASRTKEIYQMLFLSERTSIATYPGSQELKSVKSHAGLP